MTDSFRSREIRLSKLRNSRLASRSMVLARISTALIGWRRCACLALILTAISAESSAIQIIDLQKPDETAAQNIAQIALRAQNSNDYPFAAQQWEKLLTSFPTSKLAGKAHYNAGVCYVQIQDFKSAATQLTAAISKLTGDDTELQPQAYLFLGFSQLRAGQALNGQTDPASTKEANILLTTAAKTLADLLKKFPDFVDADQACYFQGNAFEELDQLEEAEKSYAKMIGYPKQTFKLDCLFAIGNVNERLGRFSIALEYYEKFRSAAAEAGGHPLLDEVNFRTAKTQIAMAVVATNSGDAAAAVKGYQSAESLFGALADQDKTGKTPEFLAMSDEAQYQQAYCLTQLSQFDRAAQVYEAVAARADSPFRTQALVYAGRSYLQAKKIDLAIASFEKGIATKSPFAIEGAVSLSNVYLKNNKFQSAFELADQWIKNSEGSPLLPLLMADRADAAYQMEDKRAQSPALFLEIVDKYPAHSVAPSALYNAAYASLELSDFDNAIKYATQFTTAYPQSDFLADTLEVKADALLLNNDAAAAEIEFDQLIGKFGTHEKSNRWRLRSAVAKFLLEKYQATIDLLQPALATFTEAKQLAEAAHWIGASQFNLGQFEPAIESLKKSIAAPEQWRSADETLLTLARAQFKANQPDAAKVTLQQMMTQYKDSPLLGKAYFSLGEHAYQAEQFDVALENFQRVIALSPDPDLTPNALFNAAWSQLKLEKFAESEALFTKLLTDFPQHALADEAKIGRGAARRKTGKMQESIADLTAFLASNPTGQAKFNAMYELGLAQVETKLWPEAVKTFESLLAEDPNSPRADRYHYELAWALRSFDQPAAALVHFTSIAEKLPTSPLAAEANFHLGTAAYEQDQFPAAIAAYEKCVAAEDAGIVREKALYKLGWAHYKQDQFETANVKFAKQIELFPAGELAADGKFMVAESQFRQKKYESALVAYRVAKPAIEAAIKAAGNIDPKIESLTLLHGAQAANQTKQYAEALNLIMPLTTAQVDKSFQADAWLEVGTANDGLGNVVEALAAWNRAKEQSDGTTGARAACMIGDQLFKQKKFAAAINEFKEVNYRFSGEGMLPETKPWVAYALYEGARCSFVQVADAPAGKKSALIAEAIKQFETLVTQYPEDRLAQEAKNQLEKLKKIQL